ncbi:MAG: hypothetical protein ACD_30C00005G0004 [uncultured bacterium]|uniref:Uncharacterized protein n=4 Tax=Candidatus Daviesiibacteriota TaxID=1752718 RepID=A0A0G0HUC6_9BACT|nr:MAG: hypothetical protein ACD_30C00005G0004 [uncultured bacterium]KKQ07501.1 MAG: hypothetical protein US19_C0044G0018 [Candidatus Daviesbacteria bacterium GW2011_GWB1_36_5]KKQ15135.1 MAG: hypothetical protein US28_C0022G0007 [Candidatus Daviesbacteria bacterium GW2011_GWA1_36_8]OGE16626.1 MAG: hypothetical protein A2858_02155 [Candidatus Daviesbacteria bacterium RIFCSPHIGHO2_01_FULL_36_37]OGE33364.1 MAG: hypothetical protein A3C99_01585 [Candidatus Daviesbacteria bacterium RIFCSPHIGHO2_02_F
MIKTHFYSHLIEIESLVVELDKLELSDTEKNHLAALVDSNLHHTILDVILSELSEQDKKIFMEHLSNDDKEKIWEHLNSKVNNIEEKIKTAAEDIKNKMHEDIKESKRGSK